MNTHKEVTRYQLDVLKLVTAGWTYEKIAHHYDITRSAVAMVIRRMMKQHDAVHVAQLVHKMWEMGYLVGDGVHGTPLGVGWHKRRGQVPCPACEEGGLRGVHAVAELGQRQMADPRKQAKRETRKAVRA